MATVERAASFDADLVPLLKRHRKLARDLDAFLNDDLAPAPKRRGAGRMPIPGLRDIWKTRMGIPSANIGASGGLRFAYFVSPDGDLVVLLRAWAKADLGDLPRKVMDDAKDKARPLIEQKARDRGMTSEQIEKLFT